MTSDKFIISDPIFANSSFINAITNYNVVFIQSLLLLYIPPESVGTLAKMLKCLRYCPVQSVFRNTLNWLYSNKTSETYRTITVLILPPHIKWLELDFTSSRITNKSINNTYLTHMSILHPTKVNESYHTISAFNPLKMIVWECLFQNTIGHLIYFA